MKSRVIGKMEQLQWKKEPDGMEPDCEKQFNCHAQGDVSPQPMLQLPYHKLQDAVNKYVEENKKLNQHIISLESFIREAHVETANDMKKYLETIELLDIDLRETGEALDEAHNKIKDDLEEMKMLIQKNEDIQRENAMLKEQEIILKNKVDDLTNDQQESAESTESEESEAEDSSFVFFWRNDTEKKVRALQKALKEAYVQKVESERKLAVVHLQLKKSRDFILNQEKIISKLEQNTKKNHTDNVSYTSDKERNNTESMQIIPERFDTIAEISKLETQLADMREEKANLELNVNRLKEILDKEKRKKVEREKWMSQEIQDNMEGKIKEVRQLETENVDLLKRLEQYNRHLDAQTFEKDALGTKINQLDAENRDLRLMIMKLENARHGEAEKETVNEFARENEILRNKVEELQNCYYFKVEENIDLNKSLNEAQHKVNLLNKEKEQSSKLKKHLKFETDVDSYSGAFENIADELVQLKLKLNRYTSVAGDTNPLFCEKLETNTDTFQQEVDVVSIHDSDFTTTSLETADCPNTCQNNSSARQETNSISQRIKSHKMDSPLFFGQKEQQKDHLQSVNIPTVDEESNKQKSQHSNCERIGRRISSTKKSLISRDTGLGNLLVLVKEVKAQVDKITNSMDIIEFEKDDLELELKRLKSQDTQYYNVNLRLAKESLQLKKDLNNAQEKIRILMGEKHDLTKTVELLDATVNETDTKFNTQLAGWRKQSEEINDMKANNAVLSKEMNELKVEQEKSGGLENVQQEDRQTFNELGPIEPRRKVADMVEQLEQSQLFTRSRQPPPGYHSIPRIDSFPPIADVHQSVVRGKDQ